MKRVALGCVALAVGIGGLTGCGKNTTPQFEHGGTSTAVSTQTVNSTKANSNIAHQNPKSYPAQEKPVVMKELPQGMVSHLQPYMKRIQHVSSLPIHLPSSVQSVLVISGVTAYAIPQFQHIWSQLSEKPAVVWVGGDRQQTEWLWKQAGFHGDPLPSPVTLYENVQLPVPTAYHKAKDGWDELPGILPSNEIDDWKTFFGGQRPHS